MDAFLAILFLIGFPIATIYFFIKWYRIKKKDKQLDESFYTEISNLKTEKLELENKLKNLEIEISKLIKYQNVLDAENEAKEIIKNAINEANKTTESAISDANNIIEKSKEEIRQKTNSAELILNNAIKKSEKIIDEANIKAKQIAGAALDAKDKAEEYIKTEKAMRNIINGYGHTYLIPNISILDDLAEEYSFTEAGEKLKQARSFTRSLIKDKKAATCDYVDKEKYDTAIRFVTDAFNGKVDSALSKVKYDNYGTIKQQIEDAFSVVNETGRAFRSAKISKEYFSARMEELKWAVATNELKKIEQEEQRRIKELMREEEKAQREIQKALEEAEKEEKMLKKAMEEAQRQIQTASNEEKLEFEAKLNELQEKLRIAEEKNQRALSMAQQTRSGHVYIISNIGSFGENIYKIGMTRRLEPKDRVTELGDASVPFSFDIHAMIYSSDAPNLEKILHRKFVNNQVNKINPRKEFFDVSLSDIKKIIDDMGIEAHWTLTAEAKEYYESKAIVKPIEYIEEKYEEQLAE